MPFPNPDTQFKPGNPGGALSRKGRSVTARLRELLEQGTLGGKPLPNGKQVADLLAEVIVKNALKGDHRFVATVLDRIEGKIGEKVELTGKDGAPLVPQTVKVEFVDADSPPQDPAPE